MGGFAALARLSTLCCLFAFLGTSERALAQAHDSIAILSLEITGDGPPELRKQLQEQIRLGLHEAGGPIVPFEAVQKKLSSTPELIGCFSTTCLQRIAELTSAERFVRAKVEANGATYTIELRLLAADDQHGTRVADSCAVCTIGDLNDLMTRLSAELLAPSLRHIQITSIPNGATIVVDGDEKGKAPLVTELRLGEHQVVATFPGRDSVSKTIRVDRQGSESEVIELRFPPTLPPSSDVTKGVEPTSSPYGFWKWATAGAAATGLAVGTALIVIDGDPTCDTSAGQTCATYRDTLTSGVLTFSLGAALGGVSAWMFWQDSLPQAAVTTTSIAVTPTKAMATYRLAF